MAIAYAITLIISIALLILYCALINKKEVWTLSLFCCVCIANLGYLLLSVSKTVEFALFSNKIAYLGNVFLLSNMYLTITKLCGFKFKKSLPIALLTLSFIVFALICTSGYLPWYYKQVWIENINGATSLEKIYGPLHKAYLVYVIGYFVAMISTIILSVKQKKLASQKQAGFLSVAVLCNIIMWIVERFLPINFEFLSVSYVLTIGMLFFFYWMMQDYVKADQVNLNATASRPIPVDIATMSQEEKILKVLSHLKPGEILAPREREILELILQNKKRKDIANQLHLSENTIKTYTRTLYSKINVTSREELYALIAL